MLLEGQQFGRYRLVRLLGSGGMGDVYLAEDARIEQQVAIKVIRAEVNSYPANRASEEALRLFQREARTIAKLDHPNILPLFDFGEEQIGDTTMMYLVMPYRQEGSLANWLRQRLNDALLSPQEVAHIVWQASLALQHAHSRQVIHQDVKPSNFLLRYREDASGLHDLLLTDFGVARFMTATSSASQSIRGTPFYMAPEQWEGEPVPATDQYALAVMAYELLTGRLPFQGSPGKMMYQHINVQPQPPSTFNAHLSSDIDTVLLYALEKQPERRFASIMAFANAFQQAVQSIQSDEEIPPPSDLETVEKTVLPIGGLGVETAAPTVLNSSTQLAGNDFETYVKPINTPSPIPFTPAAPLPRDMLRSENITPVVTTRLRKARHRSLVTVALIVIVLALLSGVAVFALPALLDNSSIKATVIITPANSNLKNIFIILGVTGTPDPSKQQIAARVLSSTSPSSSKQTSATGVTTVPATFATGILTIMNSDTSPAFVAAGTKFGADVLVAGNFLEVVTSINVTIPSNANVNVPAYADVAGTIGNIPAKSILPPVSCGYLCPITLVAQNYAPFTGGQDTQTYSVVQQSDIDNAAQALEKANAPNPQQMLQSQIRSNEREVGTPQCKPNVTSDHKAGDKATNITVTVNYTCKVVVYDYDGASSLASTLLKNQAMTYPGNGYMLVGNINTNVIIATLTNANQGTVTVQVSATGMWVYQFSKSQQQQLARLIAGKSKQIALALLTKEPGVGNALIQLQGSDNAALPTEPSSISIIIQPQPGS